MHATWRRSQIGTAIAVAEAARNISCTGAEPSAITNCLNFRNPYNPEVYWQFVGAIQGMGRACRHFNTPVTGGNVSFYNQTAKPDGSAQAVFPTPTIGMVGVMNDRRHHTGLDFKEKGELIFQLGGSSGCINASEYLANIVGIDRSPALISTSKRKASSTRACVRSPRKALPRRLTTWPMAGCSSPCWRWPCPMALDLTSSPTTKSASTASCLAKDKAAHWSA